MSDGDPIKAGHVTSAQHTTDLVGEATRIDLNDDFVGNVILKVAPQIGTDSPRRVIGHAVDGIQGFATDPGDGSTGIGVAGFGSPSGGTGVQGMGGAFPAFGRPLAGGIGVKGIGGNSSTTIPAGEGVVGFGGTSGGVGVVGVAGGTADGIVGTSTASGKSGVVGFNLSLAGSAAGVFGLCNSPAGAGISGFSSAGAGVLGTSTGKSVGVLGRSALPGGTGVRGAAVGGFGVVGTVTGAGFSGFFDGAPVLILSGLMVVGAKSAVVPHADGSHRQLYSLECPESWFEDFGEGKLVNGKAGVKLDSGFAAVVRVNQYHVFLTPYGDSRGLYVTNRTSKGFEVREQQGGKGNVKFSYRIVAKRKDIKGERLKKVSLPSSPPKLPNLEKLTAPEYKPMSRPK